MRVTLRDIARQVGLSHATVSFVLNDRRDVSIPEATRERVRRAAHEMGYRPNRAARCLVGGRTGMIGLWCPSVRGLHFARVFDAVQRRVAARGCDLVHLGDLYDVPVPDPITVTADGLVVWDVARPFDEAFPAIPVVAVGLAHDPRADQIAIRLRSGLDEAVERLLAAGRRRFAVLGWAGIFSLGTDGRLPAIEDLRRRPGVAVHVAAFSEPSGTDVRWAVDRLLDEFPDADALLCLNDTAALAALARLCARGVAVPDRIAVIGFDGLDVGALVHPPLTTVEQPVEEVAERAVALLFERLEDPARPLAREGFPTRLLVRESG